MEEVWKREQAAAKEDQKLADLRKQIAEERAREELHSMAEAAGVQVRQDRLDWMYQGGVMARQEADQRAAAQEPQPEPSTSTEARALPSFYTNDTPASANEMWQRLHTDPLFAMKQQELVMRRQILANPVQMEAIKAKVKDLRPDKKAKKKDKKRERERERERERSPPGVSYGLSYAHHTADAAARSGRAEQTRRHLEEAARRQEEERRAAEAQARQKRVQYKAGRLTDEERAAKLAAMWPREEREESTVAARTADSAAAFLEAAQRETLAATVAKGMSLEEAVNRRKHFQQRGAAASGAGFRR
ncbi:hypothetical protein QBZ16_000513 [Prototheca wickerhamii]|uniref:Uncharacterized protein n=1 Tax=Prototheca wickerhamii TaxID=3111 RepID=A0AAD9ILA2_PROWI|nr:hypothetical protein QBZ16_000513 [Prototheca wickerhamii]